jgi:hypothetical protein
MTLPLHIAAQALPVLDRGISGMGMYNKCPFAARTPPIHCYSSANIALPLSYVVIMNTAGSASPTLGSNTTVNLKFVSRFSSLFALCDCLISAACKGFAFNACLSLSLKTLSTHGFSHICQVLIPLPVSLDNLLCSRFNIFNEDAA